MESWLRSLKEQGKVLHLISEVLSKVENGQVSARVGKIMPISELDSAVKLVERQNEVIVLKPL